MRLLITGLRKMRSIKTKRFFLIFKDNVQVLRMSINRKKKKSRSSSNLPKNAKISLD